MVDELHDARAALRRAIRSRRWTLERAAAAVGVERETLWRWLSGAPRRRGGSPIQPSTDKAYRIEAVFGVAAFMWARGRRPSDL